MTMFDGLTSRWTQPGARHVVQRGRGVHREREELLERERVALVDQRPQRRALEELDQQVRVAPVEHRVEAADEHGVGERGERLGLAAQLAQRARVLDLVGPQELGDHDREPGVVPDEVDVVAAAAAEAGEHAAAGRDLVALHEPPGGPRPRDGLPGRPRGERRLVGGHRPPGPSSSPSTSAVPRGSIAALSGASAARPAHTSGVDMASTIAVRSTTAAGGTARAGVAGRAVGEREERAGEGSGFVSAGRGGHRGRASFPGRLAALIAPLDRHPQTRRAGFPTRACRPHAVLRAGTTRRGPPSAALRSWPV